MELPQTGGCQCGKVRYEITQAPRSVYTCHCTACQRLTSSAFSMGLVVAEAAFHLSGVEPKPLQRMADSGRVNTRLVCPECGCWICGLPRDGVVRVRAGSLDDVMPGNLNERVPREHARIPNVRNWAVRDYGNRVGIWRIMEVLTRYGIR